jgi:AraC-like DNA-binding protein
MDDIEQKLEWFKGIISCAYELFFWTYDAAKMQIISSNCPNEAAFNAMLALDGNKEYLQKCANECSMPVILDNSIGLTWIADFEKTNNAVIKIHLIGPIFADDASIRNIAGNCEKYNLSIAQKMELIRLLESLPMIGITRFLEYGIMLHYSISGNKICSCDFVYQKKDKEHEVLLSKEDTNRCTIWAVEQQMMSLVREGNLGYREKMSRLSIMSNIGKLSNGDPIRQFKNAIIIFTALCCREAIKGGLSPEIAYALSNYYIQKTEACNTLAELREIGNTMQEDFIKRVHQCKIDSGISRSIQELCNYIQLNIEEEFDIKEYADKLGYTVYYLTKKFKKEMGCTISQYIRNSKIDRAKTLLISTTMTIGDISDLLGFTSQSYFAEIFREVVGCSPIYFREHMRIG